MRSLESPGKPGHGPGFPGLSGNLTGRTPVNVVRQTAYSWIGPFTVLKTVPLFHPLAFSCKPALPSITFPNVIQRWLAWYI